MIYVAGIFIPVHLNLCTNFSNQMFKSIIYAVCNPKYMRRHTHILENRLSYYELVLMPLKKFDFKDENKIIKQYSNFLLSLTASYYFE